MNTVRGRKKDRFANRAAIVGITIVVGFLALAVNVRGVELKRQNHEYAIEEQALDTQIQEEEEKSKALEERKVYVKTKEYVMEKAREIFGLKMPDEIIVRPEN